MSQYRRLLDRGLDTLESALRESLAEEAAAEVAQLVGELNFPGLIGLLGTSDTAAMPDAERELDEAAAAAAAELASRNVSADDVRRLLTNTLLRRSPTGGVPLDPDLRDAMLAAAVEGLAARAGAAVTRDQARQAAQLLATGEFFRDVGDATAAILFLVRGLPLALQADMRGPRRIGRVVVALANDVGAGVFEIPAIFADLSDGRLDDPPVILANTLRALYGFASLRSTAATVQALLDPQNESVRLAIVIYARANGIPLEVADLDRVRDSLFDPDDPDLGPALVRAIERLAQERSVAEIEAMLGRMSRGGVG